MSEPVRRGCREGRYLVSGRPSLGWLGRISPRFSPECLQSRGEDQRTTVDYGKEVSSGGGGTERVR